MGDGWLCAQISDFHVSVSGPFEQMNGHLSAAVQHLNDRPRRPDLVVASGDLVNDGTDAEYELLSRLLEPLEIPLKLMPGNHDELEAMRRAFPDHDELGTGPTADWVVDGPVRIVALDTLERGRIDGRLRPHQLDWLDSTLGERPDVPTVVFLHHPPFATGIASMDAYRIVPEEAASAAAVIERHPQVERVTCGHLHRSITTRWAGTVAATVPGVAHAVGLDLDGGVGATWIMEPPQVTLLYWQTEVGLVTHTEAIGVFEGGRY